MNVVDEFTASSSATRERKTAQLRVLGRFEAGLNGRSLLGADGARLRAFLEDRCRAGVSANTVRKERGMILSFYTWAWREGHVPAEILLSIRSVAVPARSTGLAKPTPYKRWEVQSLWKLLDERWPRLAPEDAERWLRRWQEGRSPYPRVRSHLIHLQLEAMISLALACALRRAEVFVCCVDDLDPANAYIPVRGRDGTVREVPFSAMARKAVAAWLEARSRVGPPHHRAWLNLWAEATVKQAMTEHAFEKVLRTYLGVGWTFRRLRDTGAVEWLRAGVEVWHLQELLGHRSMKDTLPYLEAASGRVRPLCRIEEGPTRASLSYSTPLGGSD